MSDSMRSALRAACCFFFKRSSTSARAPAGKNWHQSQLIVSKDGGKQSEGGAVEGAAAGRRNDARRVRRQLRPCPPCRRCCSSCCADVRHSNAPYLISATIARSMRFSACSSRICSSSFFLASPLISSSSAFSWLQHVDRSRLGWYRAGRGGRQRQLPPPPQQQQHLLLRCA